jgi:hypothetical protein
MLEFGNQRLHDYGPNYPNMFAPYGIELTHSNSQELKEGQYYWILLKPIFEAMGLEHTSIDYNGEDGALQLDVRQDLTKFLPKSYDIITNLGFTEHVGENDVEENLWMNQYLMFKNMHDLGHVGTYYFNLNPHPDGWFRHGICAYRKEFFQSLIRLNGYDTIAVFETRSVNKETMAVYSKTNTNEFISLESFRRLPGMVSRYHEYNTVSV